MKAKDKINLLSPSPFYLFFFCLSIYSVLSNISHQITHTHHFYFSQSFLTHSAAYSYSPPKNIIWLLKCLVSTSVNEFYTSHTQLVLGFFQVTSRAIRRRSWHGFRAPGPWLRCGAAATHENKNPWVRSWDLSDFLNPVPGQGGVSHPQTVTLMHRRTPIPLHFISGWNKRPQQSRELCFHWAIFPGSSTSSPASRKSRICLTEDEAFAIIEKDFANTVLRSKCTVNISVPLREMKTHITARQFLPDKARAISAKCHPLTSFSWDNGEGKQTNFESIQSSNSSGAWLVWKHRQKPEHNHRGHRISRIISMLKRTCPSSEAEVKDCQVDNELMNCWWRWVGTGNILQCIHVLLKETPEGLSHSFWRSGFRKLSLFTVATAPALRDKQPSAQTGLHTQARLSGGTGCSPQVHQHLEILCK